VYPHGRATCVSGQESSLIAHMSHGVELRSASNRVFHLVRSALRGESGTGFPPVFVLSFRKTRPASKLGVSEHTVAKAKTPQQ